MTLNNIRPTVLVVDDTPAILHYLRMVLESDAYVVETASGGQEALRRLQEGTADPDVVLLDLQMPGMDGLETLRGILALRPHQKVIMCSAVSDPEVAREARALGAQAYLTKPVPHLYLSAALEGALSQRAAEQASAGRGQVVTMEPRYQ